VPRAATLFLLALVRCCFSLLLHFPLLPSCLVRVSRACVRAQTSRNVKGLEGLVVLLLNGSNKKRALPRRCV
jgi:hypothetical protein